MGGSIGGASIHVTADVSEAAKQLNKLRAELNALERAKFAPGTENAKKAAQEVDRLNKSIHALGGTVDKSGNFITRHSTALNQLAFSAARAGSGIANFLPLIARSATLLAKHEFGEGGLSGALSSLRAKFKGTNQVATEFTQGTLPGMEAAAGEAGGALGALGSAAGGAASAIGAAGFAAIGAAAAILGVVAAVGFLAAKLGPLGSELNRAQESMTNIFGAAGKEAQDFAERASVAFGITEQAVLSFLGKTGNLFKSFGIDAGRAAELSESLVVMTDVLRSTAPAFIDSATAMQAMFSVAAGNIEGLREMDIFLTEVSIKETLRAHAINVTTETLDNQQRSLAALLAVNDIAIQRFDQYIKTQDSAARTSERTAAAFKDIKTKLGEGLAPLLALVANAFLGVLIAIRGIAEGAQDFFDRHPLIVKALKAIGEVALNMLPALRALITVVGSLGDKGKEAAEKSLDLEERMQRLLDGGKALEEQLGKTFEPTLEQLQRLRDAHISVQRAIEDAARAEQDALLDLQRAREDAVKKSADAFRKLEEAEEDQEQAIFDARRKRHDVQIKNFRSIRDAEEKLKEARVEGTKKVDEAERDLFDARMERLRKILNASITLEEALLAGDTRAERAARLALIDARQTEAIEKAKLKLDEERKDRAKKIKEAQRDLDEERFDAQRRLADANRDLARTIDAQAEAMAAARREVHEAEIEINRSLFDANKNLLDTQRESAEAIGDAKSNLTDLNFELGTTNLTFGEILDKLERMQNGLLVAAANAHKVVEEGQALRDILEAPLRDSGAPDRKRPKDVGDIWAESYRADGGRMLAGRPYITSERGPELVIPNSNSTVVSNEQVMSILRQMAGGRSGANVTNHIYETNDGEATAAAVINRMVLEGMS